jgi:HK97 family phage prohead protease
MPNLTPFHLDLRFKEVVPQQDGSLVLRGYASTYETDRDREAVTPEALKKAVAQYLANPILLLQHDPDKPIGKITSATVDDKGLFVEALVSPPVAEWAREAYQKIKDGVFRAFSIGGLFQKLKNAIIGMDLMEISVVSVPANPTALFEVAEKSAKLGASPADVPGVKAGGNLTALLDYWREQMGGGEGQEGDFDACVEALSKHDEIDDPKALCAWLHQQATGSSPGHAPGENAAKVRHRKQLPAGPVAATGEDGDAPEGSYEDLHQDLMRAAWQMFGTQVNCGYGCSCCQSTYADPYGPIGGYGCGCGMNSMGGNCCPCALQINATFPTFTIVQVCDGADIDYYQVEYTLGADGEPVLGTYREVQLAYVPGAPDDEKHIVIADGKVIQLPRNLRRNGAGAAVGQKHPARLTKVQHDKLSAALKVVSEVFAELESKLDEQTEEEPAKAR